MVHPKKIFLFIFFLFSCLNCVKSQDLEQLGGPLLTLKGNISAGTSFYQAFNRESRRSPISYFISANPTFSIYGIDIPISLSYRDQQGSISSPFNRLSFNPRYKWVQLNLGKFTKTLGTYSLSGQIIKGAAIDLTPGKFRLSFVRGSMENALIQLDTLLDIPERLPVYQRNSIGGKIGFGSSKNFIDLIVFKAKDDFNSIDPSINNLAENLPEENLVLGTSFGLSPAKWISFKSEVNASAHTANQESEDYVVSEEIVNFRENYGDVLTLNHSTKLQFAIGSKLQFKFKKFGFGVEYRRVDPLYKSLGALYFQEDYENILLKTNFSLLAGKLRINGRGGIQRNNLNNLRKVSNNRQILNANLAIIPNQNLSIVARYSNFQTERAPGLVAVNDSLRYAKSTGGYGITPRYMFGSKDKRSTVILGFNRLNLIDLLDEEPTGNDIQNTVLNLSYGIDLKPSKTGINLSLIANQNQVKGIERNRLGVNLKYSKQVFSDNLKLNVGVGGFQNFLDGETEGFSITGRVGARYKLEKSTSISAMLNFVNRSGLTGYQEIRGNLNVSYRFKDVSTSKINKAKTTTPKI